MQFAFLLNRLISLIEMFKFAKFGCVHAMLPGKLNRYSLNEYNLRLIALLSVINFKHQGYLKFTYSPVVPYSLNFDWLHCSYLRSRRKKIELGKQLQENAQPNITTFIGCVTTRSKFVFSKCPK